MTRTTTATPATKTLTRHELLVGLQERLRPRTYLEIGVSTGASLSLSRVPSVGIDPAYKVVTELTAKVRLARATSDDYFAQEDPKRWLGGPIDLAFIDGMHLFEFALRDFMNVEKHSRWSTVVVLDDMLPRNVDEAARHRFTKAWAGDVFWVAEVLRRYRPDLTVLDVNTRPTGTVVVTGLDPESTVLEDHYDEILAEYVHEDPQPVPESVLRRSAAWDPQKLLDLPLWGCLHRGAWPTNTRDRGLREIEEAIARPSEYRRRRRAVSVRARRLAQGVTGRAKRLAQRPTA